MSSSYHPQTDGQSEVTNRSLYGRNPPMVPRYELGSSLVHEVDNALATRDEILRIHLSRSVHQMKQLADKKCRDVEFHPGDFVYLKLQPYRQQSVSKRAFQKLASRFYGPFLVEEKIGNLAYRLQLPSGSKIHPVFHVSLLKKHIGDAVPTSSDFPQLTDDGYFVFEPAEECTADLQARFPTLNLEDKVPTDGGGTDRPIRRSSKVIIKNKKYLD
ncbi:hypothetical protein MANES_12G106122v8 [Manihot esculenta]|uniref:Uncharacterized protein n=1 Tax=Manihot esculenta TaxID=3983 RepID=A0ACB7GRR2_MANES|nr:hypothetical protein MANES_12G106122v8 [Manihot esculenta]